MKYNINNPKPTPSQECIKQLINYDPNTGVATWTNDQVRVDLRGKVCGSQGKGSYRCVSIAGEKYQLHRLIYKLMTGKEPVIMDHVNGHPDDNRWCNLRSVTHKENSLNLKLPVDNKSGSIGVYFHEKQNRWLTSVRQDNVSYHLGSFKTKEEAVAARKAANVMLGFSDRHGEAA